MLAGSAPTATFSVTTPPTAINETAIKVAAQPPQREPREPDLLTQNLLPAGQQITGNNQWSFSNHARHRVLLVSGMAKVSLKLLVDSVEGSIDWSTMREGSQITLVGDDVVEIRVNGRGRQLQLRIVGTSRAAQGVVRSPRAPTLATSQTLTADTLDRATTSHVAPPLPRVQSVLTVGTNYEQCQ
ncbi:hypothetical protein ACGFIR_31075 [Micromonospora sp. NPDC049051]|uniref:hypothetical protein n=1 Tax=Micromonospora sp. NPDC049051 TaxID=3364264 RepID=UPI00370FCED8